MRVSHAMRLDVQTDGKYRQHRFYRLRNKVNRMYIIL